MTPGRDDDALTWEGDDDPTLDVGAAPAAPPSAPEAPDADAATATDAEAETASAAVPDPGTASPENGTAAPASLPEGWNAVGKGSESVAADGTARRQPVSSAGLITLGILGGFYLLYTVGWLIGGLRLQGEVEYLVADAMFQGSFWLAVLAPALWFVMVVMLTARSAAWIRLSWLIAGAVLLVPWPFIMVGAIGR